jgi:hypothetical protein
MAKSKPGPYAQLIAALKKTGCRYCPVCHAYMPAAHTENSENAVSRHVRLVADTHRPKFVVVGGYGQTRLVPREELAS